MSMAGSSPPRMIKRRRRSHHDGPPIPLLQHSFHVLTDGSEHSGPATVFLSVQPTATTTVRYALTGLSGMIARLSADQKFPLHHTRAVFMPTAGNSNEGLASLLLTLSQAGASQLTVCGGFGTSDYAHSMAHLIIPNSPHPRVVTCQLEREEEEEEEAGIVVTTPRKKNWFCIYEDDHLVVHAKACNCAHEEASSSSSAAAAAAAIVLVYTLLLDTMTCASFAVVPSTTTSTTTTNGEDLLGSLPEYVGTEPLDFILFLNGDSIPTTTTTSSKLRTKRILTIKEPREWDDGLLIRAHHASRQRHDQWPLWYPYNHNHDNDYNCYSTNTIIPDKNNVVTTCTRWWVGNDTVDHDSWKREIWNKCRRPKDDQNGNAKDTTTTTTLSLLPPPPLSRKYAFHNDEDENEIDLNDDDDDDGNDSTTNTTTGEQKDTTMVRPPPPPPRVPHLLVLGSGCASPSPQRGSSGYAVFLPTQQQQQQDDGTTTTLLQLQIVLECGEGYLTSLKRHMPHNYCGGSTAKTTHQLLSHICLIWISHAHLDHYGGLPCLLRARAAAAQHRDDDDDDGARSSGGRFCTPKQSRLLVPLVVAPQRVLDFLTATLLDSPNSFFQGMTHAGWESSSQQQQRRHLPDLPFDYLHSVPVNHCPDAHGLVLGLCGNVCLCYSGDGRPSGNLIRAHAKHKHNNNNNNNNNNHQNGLTLLLHEATFLDDESELARRKRHSTVSEALAVGRDMNVHATLLTHCSQRYNSTKVVVNNNDNQHCHVNYGWCQDGLWLALTRNDLSNIFPLNDM